MENITVRQLHKEEFPSALSLVWDVFTEYEAPDYGEEGTEEFYKSIHDPNYLGQLAMFGAYSADKLVGVIATRNNGVHITLFFVDSAYHRKGIGKRLFQRVLEQCTADVITVNSSPYAVPVYHKLGFRDTDKEQTVNGLRFTPMKRVISESP